MNMSPMHMRRVELPRDGSYCLRCTRPVDEAFGGYLPHVAAVLMMQEIFRCVKNYRRTAVEEGPMLGYLRWLEAMYGSLESARARASMDSDPEVQMTDAMVADIANYVHRPVTLRAGETVLRVVGDEPGVPKQLLEMCSKSHEPTSMELVAQAYGGEAGRGTKKVSRPLAPSKTEGCRRR